MTNVDIKKVEDRFARAIGNGKMACDALNDLVICAAGGETGPLHRSLNKAVKRGDEQAANIMVAVIERVFGVKVKRAKGKIVDGLSLDGQSVCSTTLNALHEAAAEKLSIRGAAFKKKVLPSDKPKTTFAERMAMLVKQGRKEGLTEVEMTAAFRAAMVAA